jgi:hypothetical protein
MIETWLRQCKSLTEGQAHSIASCRKRVSRSARRLAKEVLDVRGFSMKRNDRGRDIALVPG